MSVHRIDDLVETNSAAMLKDDGESVASLWCHVPHANQADFGFDNLTYCEYHFPQCQTSFSILEKIFKEKVENTKRLKDAAPQDEKKPEADLVTVGQVKREHEEPQMPQRYSCVRRNSRIMRRYSTCLYPLRRWRRKRTRTCKLARPPLRWSLSMPVFPPQSYTFYWQHATAAGGLSSPFLCDGIGCGRGKGRRSEEYDCSYA